MTKVSGDFKLPSWTSLPIYSGQARGRATGILGSMGFLGIIVSVLAFGWISATNGLSTRVFVGVLALVLAFSLLAWFLLHFLKKLLLSL